jgi:hypothetical protein
MNCVLYHSINNYIVQIDVLNSLIAYDSILIGKLKTT